MPATLFRTQRFGQRPSFFGHDTWRSISFDDENRSSCRGPSKPLFETRRPRYLEPLGRLITAETEKQARVGLRDEAGTAHLDFGQHAGRGPETDLGAERVAAAVGAAQGHSDESGVCADVVAEEVVGLAVHGAEKNIQVAVVVEIGEDRTATVVDRIGPCDSRNVEEPPVTEVEGNEISLVAREGESVGEELGLRFGKGLGALRRPAFIVNDS